MRLNGYYSGSQHPGNLPVLPANRVVTGRGGCPLPSSMRTIIYRQRPAQRTPVAPAAKDLSPPIVTNGGDWTVLPRGGAKFELPQMNTPCEPKLFRFLQPNWVHTPLSSNPYRVDRKQDAPGSLNKRGCHRRGRKQNDAAPEGTAPDRITFRLQPVIPTLTLVDGHRTTSETSALY